MAPIKVLLVDDDLDYAQIVSERLGLRGFEIDTARGALEAITALKYQDYQVVILDIDDAGFVAAWKRLRKIKDEHPGVQVILQTGHATSRLREEAARLGALALMEKPGQPGYIDL